MNTPRVSVIVPCHNVENSVVRALDSLKNQSFKDLELIVIDDGSTDHTWTVLEQYQKENPSLCMQLIHTENQGIAKTRTLGLSKVNGTYFAFLDSDDYTSENMIQDMVDLAEKDQLDLVVSDFYWVNSKGERLQKEGPYSAGPDMVVNLFAVLWNKLYRTSFIRSLDLVFPEGHHYEDTCYVYCLAGRVKQIGFTNNAYVRYVQNENSITHVSDEQVENMVSVFEKILKYYEDHELSETFHDALEYVTIKTFLGNNFLRAVQIPEKEERKKAIYAGWNLLNKNFPGWHKNSYMHKLGGMKNRYFQMVNSSNLMFFAWIFKTFKKDNL